MPSIGGPLSRDCGGAKRRLLPLQNGDIDAQPSLRLFDPSPSGTRRFCCCQGKVQQDDGALGEDKEGTSPSIDTVRRALAMLRLCMPLKLFIDGLERGDLRPGVARRAVLAAACIVLGLTARATRKSARPRNRPERYVPLASGLKYGRFCPRIVDLAGCAKKVPWRSH